MAMIKDNQKHGEERIGNYKKNTIEYKVFKIERKSFESGSIFLDQIERNDISYKGCKEHIDHEYQNHFIYYLVP